MRNLTQCPKCEVFTSNGPDHVCVEYNGSACATCGAGTVIAYVAAPGYGTVRICAAGHSEDLTPVGILTPADVR